MSQITEQADYAVSLEPATDMDTMCVLDRARAKLLKLCGYCHQVYLAQLQSARRRADH